MRSAVPRFLKTSHGPYQETVKERILREEKTR